MADTQISFPAVSAAPNDYEVASSAEYRIKAVHATFTDNGAGSAWLPSFDIISDSGHVVARGVDQAVSVAAGASADVSWFPRVRRSGAVATGPSCMLLGSGNGTDTLTLTLTKAVPGTGTLHFVFAQISIPDGVDGGSDLSSVSDSKGVAGWHPPGFIFGGNQIGDIRQTEPLNAWSIQCGSGSRSCIASDLVIGDTVTGTFSTVAPANFHTTGLLVYQPAYNQAIKQGGNFQYATGDNYPDTSLNPKECNYNIDFGGGFPIPDQDAAFLAAACAYPPQAGFAPLGGSPVGEIASGFLSLAAVCGRSCGGVQFEPGGTWPANNSGWAVNYQVAQPRICSN